MQSAAKTGNVVDNRYAQQARRQRAIHIGLDGVTEVDIGAFAPKQAQEAPQQHSVSTRVRAAVFHVQRYEPATQIRQTRRVAIVGRHGKYFMTLRHQGPNQTGPKVDQIPGGVDANDDLH